MLVQINNNSNSDPMATSTSTTTTSTTNAIWCITKYKNKYPMGNNSHNVSPTQKSLKSAVEKKKSV